jgi:hypothetical protein
MLEWADLFDPGYMGGRLAFTLGVQGLVTTAIR